MPQRTTEEHLAGIQVRLDSGSKRMDSMQEAIADNTAVTNEIRDLLAAVRTGMKVLGWIGTAAKWAGTVAAGIAAVWSLLHIGQDGHLPK